MNQMDTGLHLEAMFGGLLGLSAAVVARMKVDQPEMFAKALHLVENGQGALEARVLVEPAPMVILLIRLLEDGRALELARLPVPDATGPRH